MATVSFINATDSSYDTAQATATSATHDPTKTTQPATTSQGETVKISAAAQARMLRQEGQSVANIAASLGTNTKTVDDYLGITVTDAIEKALQAAESASTSKA
jgi:hypothetical protein